MPLFLSSHNHTFSSEWAVSQSSRSAFFALTISLILATPSIGFAQDYQVSYIHKNTLRKTSVTWPNLNQVHSIAYKDFISNLSKELQSSKTGFTISEFKTYISTKAKGQYRLEYEVKLDPCIQWCQLYRIVDMRGTVMTGRGALWKAKNINQGKVPVWQSSMNNRYSSMKYYLSTSVDWKDTATEAILWVWY